MWWVLGIQFSQEPLNSWCCPSSQIYSIALPQCHLHVSLDGWRCGSLGEATGVAVVVLLPIMLAAKVRLPGLCIWGQVTEISSSVLLYSSWGTLLAAVVFLGRFGRAGSRKLEVDGQALWLSFLPGNTAVTSLYSVSAQITGFRPIVPHIWSLKQECSGLQRVHTHLIHPLSLSPTGTSQLSLQHQSSLLSLSSSLTWLSHLPLGALMRRPLRCVCVFGWVFSIGL